MYELFDIFAFNDAITSNPRHETMGDTITFSDGISSNFIPIRVSDVLTFSDEIRPGAVHNVRFADGITFTEATHPRAHIETFGDFLFFWDEIKRPVVFEDSLVFTDTMVASVPDLSDKVVFTDTVGVQLIRLQTIGDELVLHDGMPVCIYDPWRLVCFA